jgi:hypothetical protein
MAALETLLLCDYSMAIKAGVHFTLCGGTIAKLGTAKHHAAYLDRCASLRSTYPQLVTHPTLNWTAQCTFVSRTGKQSLLVCTSTGKFACGDACA